MNIIKKLEDFTEEKKDYKLLLLLLAIFAGLFCASFILLLISRLFS